MGSVGHRPPGFDDSMSIDSADEEVIADEILERLERTAELLRKSRASANKSKAAATLDPREDYALMKEALEEMLDDAKELSTLALTQLSNPSRALDELEHIEQHLTKLKPRKDYTKIEKGKIAKLKKRITAQIAQAREHYAAADDLESLSDDAAEVRAGGEARRDELADLDGLVDRSSAFQKQISVQRQNIDGVRESIASICKLSARLLASEIDLEALHANGKDVTKHQRRIAESRKKLAKLTKACADALDDIAELNTSISNNAIGLEDDGDITTDDRARVHKSCRETRKWVEESKEMLEHAEAVGLH